MNPVLRCAIYTRKSTEEGLDQAFNSLDAQREACEAYVLSQKHEGWKALPDKYDDGGFSGGNMDRPGLARLLTDIQKGKVQVVVVYKVDRLTRSLADFAKIVEQFDRQGVSFVSVTQQFNTTSSMGRLTLNVLLSFAQFEREVAGERIRDKIAASKKKGMWMGGSLSLGYGVKDRKLYIIPEEAETVHHIYRRYLNLKCVRRLQIELMERGIRSKTGSVLSRGALYQILKNPLYIGKVAHKGNIYDGQHEGLIPEELWHDVQAQMKEQAVQNETGRLTPTNAILTGILYSSNGNRLTPAYANKNGRLYRYYIDVAEARSPKKERKVRRIPADNLERMVLAHLRDYTMEAGDKIPCELSDQIISDACCPDRSKVREIILALVEKIVVSDSNIVVRLKRHGEEEEGHLTIPYRFQSLGRGKALVDGRGSADDDISAHRQTLLRNLIRGFCLRERLFSSPEMTMAKLAEEEVVNGTHLMSLINLTYLSPKIVTRIVEGKTPVTVLMERFKGEIPLSWHEQISQMIISNAS